MNWLRRLFRHDEERERKDVQLTRLEQRADATVVRADRVLAEQKQLVTAIRKTVKAMRAEHDRR